MNTFQSKSNDRTSQVYILSSSESIHKQKIKTIEDQEIKQAEALQTLKPINQKLTVNVAIPEDKLNKGAKIEV